MSIESIVVGSGPVASMIVLRPTHGAENSSVKLPIRIGRVEAAAISMGVDSRKQRRPMTHDLLKAVIDTLSCTLNDVVIHSVRGTTFYAHLRLKNAAGETVFVDSRPSDAIALAVRMHAPIYADQSVLDIASLPDFEAVERDARKREEEEFHQFVEGLSPEDF